MDAFANLLSSEKTASWIETWMLLAFLSCCLWKNMHPWMLVGHTGGPTNRCVWSNERSCCVQHTHRPRVINLLVSTISLQLRPGHLMTLPPPPAFSLPTQPFCGAERLLSVFAWYSKLYTICLSDLFGQDTGCLLLHAPVPVCLSVCVCWQLTTLKLVYLSIY